jgi:hypothetical protein
MHRKLVFSVAAVFLVIALVVPPTLIILQTNNTIYKYIIPGIYPTEGSTNVTITVSPQQQASFNTALTAALIIEAIFVVLFAITIYIGVNHTHPDHKSREPKTVSPPKEDDQTTP